MQTLEIVFGGAFLLILLGSIIRVIIYEKSKKKRETNFLKELSERKDLSEKERKMYSDELTRQKNKKFVDRYFYLGFKAESLYKKKKFEKAEKIALKQINWYLVDNNRKMLKFDLMGGLPKTIIGLDILISIYNKENKYKEIIALINEFKDLVDSESEYCDEKLLKRYQARQLRFKGEKALENNNKDTAITLFEKAIKIDPHVGIKQKLHRLKKQKNNE
jgi:tetratricopeptide (TPR) repeat protein